MYNQIDEKLSNDISELWINSGGDAEGFLYFWHRIYELIKQKEENNDDTNIC